MNGSVPSRPSTAEMSARLAEIRRMHDVLQRRSMELNQVWADARIRRAELRSARIRLRADLELRRGGAFEAERRAAAALLEAALAVSGMSLDELWLEFVAFGGTATRDELAQMIAGTRMLGRSDHDRIALALNERMEDSGFGRPVAYWSGSR